MFLLFALVFAYSVNVQAQCETGQVEYQIYVTPSGLNISDRTWEIVSESTGEQVITSPPCPGYVGGIFPFCLVPGEVYTFNAYDDYGDGWSFLGDIAWAIGFPDDYWLFWGGNPSNGLPGDNSTDCEGFDLEYSFTFTAEQAPSCTPAEVTFDAVRSCDDLNFTLSATVDVPAVTNGNDPLIFTASANGSVMDQDTVPNLTGQNIQLGPFPLETDIEVVYNVLDGTCPITKNFIKSYEGCTINLTCGEPWPISYCYQNNDHSIFRYHSPSGAPIALYFENGFLEGCCDNISIYDGADDAAPLLFSGNNSGDLSNLVVQSTGADLYLRLNTNGGNSCASGSPQSSSWTFVAGCGIEVPGCTDVNAVNYSPAATFDNGSCLYPGECVNSMKVPAQTIHLTPDIHSEFICHYPYQYSEFTDIQQGFDYQFTITGNKYITVRTGSRTGPVVGAGYANVTITAPDDENLFVHWSVDSNCSPIPSATLCAGTTAQCVNCGPQCPDLGLNIGDPCDDANPNTYNDTVTQDCQCTGIPYPTNDEPCTAVALACGDTVQQYFVGLTPTLVDNCYGTSQADAWLKFTADGEHVYTVGEGDGTILSFDAVVQLFRGDLCTGLVPVGPCQTYPESFSVHEAGTYYYRIRPISTFDEEHYPAQVHLTCQTVDCLELELNVGDPCDDGNPSTLFDTVTEDCACVGQYFEGCVNTSRKPAAPKTVSNDTSTVVISSCQSMHEYSEIDGIQAGETYKFTLSNNGYITVRTGGIFPGISVVASGYSPLTITAPNSDNLLVHWSKNAQCETSISCNTSTVQCLTCGSTIWDCPEIEKNIGDPCDDNDPFTENDVVNANCLCAGTPVPCDGFLPPVTDMDVQFQNDGVLATWTPTPEAQVCQHRLKQLSDGSVVKNYFQQQPQSGTLLAPYALFDPGTTYQWAVRCGCSADPNLAGPWNALTFTTPGGQHISSSPNPVSQMSIVKFSVQKPQSALLEVYDLNGAKLQTLFNGRVTPGSEPVFDFDVSALPQGVYVYKLTTLTEVSVSKFIVGN